MEGTHPLTGRYRCKEAFRQATFARLARILPTGAELEVRRVLVSDEHAVVELLSHATARMDCAFTITTTGSSLRKQIIVEVRAYLDSALVAKAIAENEQGSSSTPYK